ncbi:cupin domain-containing protein [Mongoliimonas terrestris]|uniref:cupin domain-containing protein n=1 Tax=Mongoliimonas terrestris TaxID=1709001 RepID=UPI0009499BFB|nr:cupin domain-containing protein [Mongoliimonas terrestris]
MPDNVFRDAAIALPATLPMSVAFGRRRFHATAAQTGGRVSVWEEFVAPGEGTPPHIHYREDETFHVLAGRVRIWCGEESFEAGPGATAVLPKGVRHYFRNESAEEARLLVVCTPGGFEGMLIDAADRVAGDPSTGPDVFGELAPRYGLEFVD